MNYGWFRRQKRRPVRRPTLHLSKTPPFLTIKDNKATNTFLRQTKSIPKGEFRPSPVIRNNIEYPEHFTVPIDEKFPRLPDYPFPFEETGKRRKVPRLSNGFKKYPTSLNDLPKPEFPQSYYNSNRGVPQYHHERQPSFSKFPVPFRENYPFETFKYE